MKKMFSVFIILFVVLCLSFPSFASWSSDLKKAKEFVVIENYELADKLIQDAILENPTKAELQYQAGLIYFDMGWKKQYTKSFRIATKLDDDYKHKVADFYEEKGLALFQNEKFTSSDLLDYFSPAVSFGGEKKKEKICKELYEISESYVLEPNFRKAGESFRALCSLDSKYSDFASNSLLPMAETYGPRSRLKIYRTVSSFSKVNNFQIGEKIAAMAKMDGAKKSFVDDCKREAKKYLSDSEYKELFPPDFVVYGPGQIKVFKLKAGEKSHFIRAQGVSNVRFQSRFGKYEIITRSGKAYAPKNIPKYFPEDFVILGVVDVDMRIVFE